MTEMIDFDVLSPPEVQFEHKGKGYVLREPDEGAVVLFQTFQLKDAKFQDGKVSASNVERIIESQSLLLGHCVFTEVEAEKEQGKPIGQMKVKEFPARIVKELFRRAKEMAGLEVVSGKNSPSATSDSSE